MMIDTEAIINSIWRLRTEMKRNNITFVAVTLGSWEEGNAFKQALMSRKEWNNLVLTEISINDDKPGEYENKMEIMGVQIRWPAKLMARHKGGFDII